MQLVDHVQALITLILGQVGWLVQWVHTAIQQPSTYVPDYTLTTH